MFPTANSIIYRNEAGEPLGWDTPSDDDHDPGDDYLGSAEYDVWLASLVEELEDLDHDALMERHAKGTALGRDELDLVHEEMSNRGLDDPCDAEEGS